MVTHIVMWRLKDSAFGRPKTDNARLVREKLEALRGQIPGLLHIEVGFDFSATETSADLVLLSEFESREALAAYQIHPDHRAVAAFVAEAAAERRIVDFESDPSP